MGNDQLFKELLQGFLSDFMELFFPDVHKRLNFFKITFLDKEVFTDFPTGERRYPDVVAQIETTDGEIEFILLHIEVQTERDREVPFRMFEYYITLHLRYRQPIFPIVLYLAPGTKGMTREVYSKHLFGEEWLRFQYAVVGVPDMGEVECPPHLAAFASAMRAWMRSSNPDRVSRKIDCIRPIFASELDDAKKYLLLCVVDQALRLPSLEDQYVREAITSEFGKEPEKMKIMNLWERFGYEKGQEEGLEKGLEKGLEEGIEKGREEGIKEGIKEGEEKGALLMLLRFLRRKFGEIPADLVSRIESLHNPEQLEAVMDSAIIANTLSDIELPEAS